MAVFCQVCEEKEKKYQCPKCKLLYCSVPCYKSHSEGCASTFENRKRDSASDLATTAEEESIERKRLRLTGAKSMIVLDEEDDAEFILPKEKLESLKNCPDLKRLLENRHLEDYLLHLNATSNPEGFMKFAMKEPLFLEFSDVCLRALHPETAPSRELSDQEVVEKIKEAAEEASE